MCNAPTKPGLRLLGQTWNGTVGTLQSSDIDISFSVKRTLHSEPNTCDLKLYALSASHRAQITQNPSLSNTETVPIILAAGLGGATSTIFSGDLRAGWSAIDDIGIVTEISSGDGEQANATARMNTAFAPLTSTLNVMSEICSVLGLGQGNLTSMAGQLTNTGKATYSAKGIVLKGNAVQILTDICASVGLEWSIQNGTIQFLPLGQPLQGQALLLSANSGLVGSPSVDSKGILHFETLLIPGLAPGQLVQMSSEFVTGGFRVVTVESEGDTLGAKWGHKCEAEIF